MSKTKPKKTSTREKTSTQKKTGYNLKIVFDGVTAVGPGHPESGDREGPFFAVLARTVRRLSDRTQRLRRERAAGGGQRPKGKSAAAEEPEHYIPMHVPTIFTRIKPTEDSRRPDRVLQLSPYHERWYLWHPIRERVEFRLDGDGTPGPLSYVRAAALAGDHGGSELPTGPVVIHGVDQVPDLRQIWPDRSVLLDGLLSPDPDVSDKVATQVLVPYGTVAGAGVLDKSEPLDVVFDPPRGLQGHDALIPNAMVMVQATTIEIATYSLDTGEPLDSIRFQLTEDAEIWVSNGDPSDVEVDMERLAVEIAERMAAGDGGGETNEARQFSERFAGTFGDDAGRTKRAALNFYHGGIDIVHGALARDFLRAGNLDLDFEVYYTLTKNEHLARDGKGLPVPKRPRDYETFRGPNCLISICETHDRLFLKSQSH